MDSAKCNTLALNFTVFRPSHHFGETDLRAQNPGKPAPAARELQHAARREQNTAAELQRPPLTERPLAASGLTSYRCKSRFGWIMIGARDHDDAMREARRSWDGARIADLEVWDGARYVPAYTATAGA